MHAHLCIFFKALSLCIANNLEYIYRKGKRSRNNVEKKELMRVCQKARHYEKKNTLLPSIAEYGGRVRRCPRLSDVVSAERTLAAHSQPRMEKVG